jgi:pimeloyl-ACP methyl ester carboxylesterase
MRCSNVMKRMTRHAIRAAFLAWCLIVAVFVAVPAQAAVDMQNSTSAHKPTIVLVHGAFADSSTWDGVIAKLQMHGYTTIAVANPLRSLSGDAAYVATIVKQVHGPVVLVGHSYAGAVITNAANDADNVKVLVYVAALAPDEGESAFDLIGKFPGSLVGASLAAPVPLDGGGKDFYVDQRKYREPFAADLPDARVRVLAATQRPVTEAALKDASGAPAWKSIPSWFIYGTADRSIPPALHQFMAKRANARETVVVKGASHLVLISHADAVAKVIEDAAHAANP